MRIWPKADATALCGRLKNRVEPAGGCAPWTKNPTAPPENPKPFSRKSLGKSPVYKNALRSRDQKTQNRASLTEEDDAPQSHKDAEKKEREKVQTQPRLPPSSSPCLGVPVAPPPFPIKIHARQGIPLPLLQNATACYKKSRAS